MNYLERVGLREMSQTWWSILVIPSIGEAEAERLQHIRGSLGNTVSSKFLCSWGNWNLFAV